MKKRRIEKEIDRVRTNIVLSKEVFNLAVDYNLNLSAFLENKLVEYFLQRKQLSGLYCIASDVKPYTSEAHGPQIQPTKKRGGKTSDSYVECGRRDLNPSFKLGKLK